MSKYSILIVDNDDNSRLSLSDILKLDGYTVQCTSRAEEALSFLQRKPFDLVILEQNIPGLGGTELFSRALKIHPEIKGIIVSAAATIETVIEALRSRVDDYLLKPISKAELRRSVNHVFREESINPRSINDPRRFGTPDSGPSQVYCLTSQVKINIRKHIIQWDEHSIVLTPTETRFLGALLDQANQIVAHADIVLTMNGYRLEEEEAAAVLRPIVSRLRKKLGSVPGGDLWVKTIRSSGYQFTGEIQTN
jgi:DNA-binding response OmpR family regulator